MVALVDLDDDESSDETEEAEGLDDVMDDGSEALLVRGGGGLEDESGLDLKQKGSGVEELMEELVGELLTGITVMVIVTSDVVMMTYGMSGEEYQRVR